MAENLVVYTVVHQPRRLRLPAQVIPSGTLPDDFAAFVFDDAMDRRYFEKVAEYSYMPATAMFGMSGQPAMSVPLAWNKAGLPLGMMFSAKLGDEGTLFRVAGRLEQARPWRGKLPPVSA